MTTSSLEFGQVVWGKLAGYPPWPALVSDEEEQGSIWVRWIGWANSSGSSLLSLEKVFDFAPNFGKQVNQGKLKKMKKYKKAVLEAVKIVLEANGQSKIAQKEDAGLFDFVFGKKFPGLSSALLDEKNWPKYELDVHFATSTPGKRKSQGSKSPQKSPKKEEKPPTLETPSTGNKAFACTKAGCMETFLSRSGLTHHINSVHEMIRYRCKDCGQEFPRRFTAVNHWKNKHSAQHEQSKKPDVYTVQMKPSKRPVETSAAAVSKSPKKGSPSRRQDLAVKAPSPKKTTPKRGRKTRGSPEPDDPKHPATNGPSKQEDEDDDDDEEEEDDVPSSSGLQNEVEQEKVEVSADVLVDDEDDPPQKKQKLITLFDLTYSDTDDN